jgi:serine/threonine-protein kinase HipA
MTYASKGFLNRPGDRQRFTQSVMSVSHARHKQLVEQVCEAIVEVTPEVIAHAEDKPGFREPAKQMLHTWNRGTQSLDRFSYR